MLFIVWARAPYLDRRICLLLSIDNHSARCAQRQTSGCPSPPAIRYLASGHSSSHPAHPLIADSLGATRGLHYGAATKMPKQVGGHALVGVRSASSADVQSQQCDTDEDYTSIFRNISNHVVPIIEAMERNTYAAGDTIMLYGSIRLGPENVQSCSELLTTFGPKKSIALVYGGPGAGKSGFVRTMADAVNRYDPKKGAFFTPSLKAGGISTDAAFEEEVEWLRGTPAMHDISPEKLREFARASHNTLALVVSYDCFTQCTQYECKYAIELGMPWFPMSARLLHQFYHPFKGRYSFNHFRDIIYHDLRSSKEMRDVVTSTCTPSQLINNLRVAYGKKHVLLLIDEITYAIDSMRPLNATLSKNIIESIASLQNDDLISTFFTTKSLQPFYEA